MKKLFCLSLILISIYLEVEAQYVEMDSPGPIYGCDGSFYDSGGGFSTYGLNESYTLTFYPSTPNSKLTFNFYDFATEYLHDFLWAYDGTSIAAPQIGVYNDGNGPLNNNITATNPDGAITFKFSSNSYTNWQGWHAVFNCIPDGSAFYTMSNLSTPQVDTVCSGFFMDNGGLSNDYSYNLNSTYTFYPATPGSSVQVNFDYFFTDEDYDGLMIYNGPDTTYPVIASPYPSTILPPTCPIYSWHGTNGPNLVKSTDISGALTFVFRSNNGWNYPGWFAPFSCVPNTGNHILMNDITTTHTTCNAMFYDSGSDLGNYSNNENYTQTFIPDNNSKKILIDFGNISLGSGDTLFVYDGLNTSGILKATYTGTNSSINISSTHPTGALTIRFKSDGSNIGAGWHAGISCVPKNYPSYLMSSTQNSHTTCVGNFYDNGGVNSNYLNQSAQTMTFYPGTPGFVTQIDFLSFNTEASFDGLRIYDGPNALAPQILSGQPVGANTLTCPANAFSGNISPGTITSSHATGALTFVFITDNSGNESGWEATVNCVNPNTISYAAFTSNVNQITVGGTVNFTDLSNNNPTSWLWSFPGGTPSSSTLQNPGNIVYNTPGCYNVVLTVSNANGSNTHTESCYIIVSVPQIPPVAAFTANNFNITVGGSINFTDLSNNYPTSWQWNFAGGTPSTSTIQNPSNIIYNTPGCYEVTLTASNAFGNDTETQTCYITVNPPSIPPTANFVANITYISPSGSVDFTDLSSSNTTQWNWTFTGGIPSSSTLQNPNNIIYNTPGCYPVKLIAINAFGSDTLEYNCYITVSNPALACTEMIISEYIESSASNRALEFQNLSSSVIDLTSYSVELYSNGASSASSSYNFTGVLGPQQVFVLAHPSANTTILAQADATSNVCNYGGNDAIALKKNGVVIDVIGEIGYYPGLNGNWIAGSGNTFDHTLVRLPYIDYPTSSWDASFTQWAAYQNGTYNYLGFNSNNCSGGAPTIPDANFMANNVTINAGQSINFTDLSNNQPTSWLWSFQGATPTSSTNQNPSNIVYNTPGCYEVSLTASNSAGSDTYTISCYITVVSSTLPPEANFTASTFNITAGQTVDFYDISTNNPTAWNWSFTGASPATSTVQNPTNIVYNTPGCYQVSLTASNAAGNNTATQTCYINVISNTGACSELFFSEYLEGVSNDKAIEIYNPSAIALNLSSYSIEMYANGAVIPTATLNLSGSLASNSVFVISNSNASAAILAQTDLTTGSVCNFNGNDAIVLKKNGTVIDVIGEIGVNPGTAWNVGSGSTLDHTLVRSANVNGPTNLWSTNQTQYISYPVGTSSYLGLNTNNCASSALVPVANFTANTFTINAGQSVNFTDLSTNTPTSWSWVFTGGTPASSTVQNPTNIVYNTPGCYQVTLTATNSAGSNTSTQTCYINVTNPVIAPVANFTASSVNITSGQSVNFTDLSTNNPTSWNWTFTGATPASSTSQNPSNITYNTAGCYQVSLTATNSAGSNTSTQTCYINVTNPVIVPVANFTASNFNITTGLSVNFTDLSTNNPTSWNWLFTGAAPASSTSQNPSNITYNTAGCYQVSLTATNSAGSNTSTQTCYITVTNPIITPVANFTANTQFINVGQSVNFTDLSTNNPTSWNWLFTGAAPASSTSQNPTNITYNTAGCYQVSLTATNSAGSNTATQTCYINVVPAGIQPQANFAINPNPACTNSDVSLLNSSTNALTFSWDMPGATPATSNSQFPVVTYANPGTYAVTLIAINGVNTDTLTQNITIYPTPAVNAGPDVGICLGSSLTLNATAAGNFSYNWSPAATLTTPNQAQTIATPTANTDYVITINDAFCSASDTVTVMVWALPPTPIITQVGNTLQASGAYPVYQWYLNNNLITGAIHDTLNAVASGDYTVNAIDTNGCISTPSPTYTFVPVGVYGSADYQFTIFPNPVKDKLYINLPVNLQRTRIEIIDVTGKIVINEEFNSNSSFLSTEQLSTGFYFLRSINDHQVDQYMFVKN